MQTNVLAATYSRPNSASSGRREPSPSELIPAIESWQFKLMAWVLSGNNYAAFREFYESIDFVEFWQIWLINKAAT